MNYKTLIPLLVVGALGAIAWRWSMERPAEADLPAKQAPTVSVDTASVTRQDVPVYLSGLGTVTALNTVTITARVDGQLQKVAFTEGQDVKAGDLLAQIDPRVYQAALDQAIAKKAQDTAQLQNAQRDLERYVALSKNDFASKQQLDTQRAQVAQLQAQIQGDQAAIENAKTQLDYTTITAPIDGRTGFRLVDQGNNVHTSDTTGIVVITQIHPITVVFTLPEENLQAVAQALAAGPVPVTALGSDSKTELAQGQIKLIDNEIDQTTGTARLKAEFPNTDNKLWPGEFVNIRVLLQTRHDALTMPSAAVQHGPDGVFTYVVKPDATVEARPLTIGIDTGRVVVVDNGLDVGEQVVTAGQYRLQPGTSVKPKAVAVDPPGTPGKAAGRTATGQTTAGQATTGQTAP